MLDQLPTELSVHIIQTAACMYRFSDRQSVVNLAMSCRTVYDIVCPILYHTLIVTGANIDRLKSLRSNTETRIIAEWVFLHARSYYQFTGSGDFIDTRLLINVESVDSCPAEALVPLVKLKSVRISDLDFRQTVSGMTPGVLQAVTHLNGFLPVIRGTLGTFVADPVGWMRSLLRNVPAVTHLGLTYSYPWKSDSDQMIARFDCTALGSAVRTALRDKPSLQCIAIRSCGRFAETRRADLETALRDVGDPRVRVWFDMRPQNGQEDHRALNILDVKEGRSLWTEVRPL